MDWTHLGKPFEDPADWVGFVYLITCTTTGRAYVGKKLFTSAKTQAPLKGKKRKRRSRVPSNWREYYGSNSELQADVERLGADKFRREILHLCPSKGMMSYLEMKEQIERDVLLKPKEYFNCFVGGKIHRAHLLKKAKTG